MLYKISGSHGGDCEEYSFLGYENQDHTEHSRLMLCKICSFQGVDYEECPLLDVMSWCSCKQDVSEERIASINREKCSASYEH
jgi:hypothetical protein